MLAPSEGAVDAPKIVVHGVEGETMDKYTAGIELSNKCREFYVCRLKAVETYRQRLGLKLTRPDLGSNPTINLGSNPALSVGPPTNSLGSKNPVSKLALGCNPALNLSHPCLSTAGGQHGKTLGSNSSLVPRKPPRPLSTHIPLSNCEPSPPRGREFPGDQTSSLSSPPRRRTSIDKSMELLKREMASLIDQDLVLMKQLLTLNEQIEELKWQRKLYGYSRGSLTASSCQLDSSACTLSEGDLLDGTPSELPQKYPTPSSLSLYKELHTHPEEGDATGSTRDVAGAPNQEKGDSTSDIGSSGELTNSAGELQKSAHSGPCAVTQPPYRTAHGEQQSFDSGIHDPDHPIADTQL